MDVTPWNERMLARDYEGAVRWAEEHDDPIALVGALCYLGRSLDHAMKDEAAERALVRAIEVADARLPADPMHWRAHARLHANVYFSRVNRYEEAVKLVREAVAILEEAVGPDDPQVAHALVTLGYRLLEGAPYLGDHLTESERVLVRAVKILERKPEDKEMLADARRWLAAVERHKQARSARARHVPAVTDMGAIIASAQAAQAVASAVHAAIEAELGAIPTLSVAFSGGTAVLSGRVASREHAQRAEQIARGHASVEDVINNLTVFP